MSESVTSTNRRRIPYYDVMKGILICYVIFQHIIWYSTSIFHIPNAAFSWQLEAERWIGPFFMPAFFLVTGICSNFDKKFKPFLIANLKTLMVPAVLLDFIFIALPDLSLPTLIDFVRRIILLGSWYWFIPTLFEAKIIYWILHRYTNPRLRWILLLLLTIVGFVVERQGILPYNYWNVRHVCELTIFLGIGQYIRATQPNISRLGPWCIGIYIVLFAGYMITGITTPYVTSSFGIHYAWDVPMHLILATTGSLATLYISQKIFSHKLLEAFGRASLVIYASHFFFLRLILGSTIDFFATISPWLCLVLSLLLFVVTISLCMGVNYLLQQKYLKCIIGKF